MLNEHRGPFKLHQSTVTPGEPHVVLVVAVDADDGNGDDEYDDGTPGQGDHVI